METALTVGSLVPAGIGLGCCVHRRTHWLGLMAMAVMLCGMSDVMLGGARLLPDAGWVVVFALAAAAQFIAAGPMRTMRIAELSVMSLLIVLMPSMNSDPAAAMPHMGAMEMSGMSSSGHSVTPLVDFLGLAAAVGYLAYAASRFVVAKPGFSRLEVAMSAVSACAMAVMLVA
jgi:hypothetical protein